MHKTTLLASLVLVACAQTAQPSNPMAQSPTPPVMYDVTPVAGVPVRDPVIGTAVSIRFDGPVRQQIPVGTNGANLYRFSLRAERNIEVRLPAFSIASLVSSDGRLGCLVNGDGMPNFANFRVVNFASGQTMSGPTGLWPTAGSHQQMLGLSSDNFQMRAGDEISLMVRGDVRRIESSCPFVGRSYFITGGRNGHFFTNGDVRILDENRAALPQEIEGNRELPGNAFTVTQPELHLGLSTMVASSTAVKGQQNVRSVAIALTANGTSDIQVNRLPPIGVGDIGRGYRRESFSSVVTTCAFFDGSTQIGPACRPNGNGRLDYRDLHYPVARGTTRVLTLQCNEQSTVQNLENGDRYAIGFVDADGVEAMDSDGNAAHVTVADALTRQLTNPTVEVTVVNNGFLSIGASPLPEGRRVTGGNQWRVVADYWVQAGLEDQSTDRVAVTWSNPFSSDCISEVAVTQDRIIHGQARVSPGMTSVDIDLSMNPLSFTTTTRRVEVMARFDMPMDGGHCMVGSQHQFGLAIGLTSGVWNSNFRNFPNLRNLGGTSHEPIYAGGAAPFGNPVTLVNPGL